MTEATRTVFVRDYCTCGGVERRMVDRWTAHQAAAELASELVRSGAHKRGNTRFVELLLQADESGVVYVAEEQVPGWCAQCLGQEEVRNCSHDYAVCPCPLVPCPRCQE